MSVVHLSQKMRLLDVSSLLPRSEVAGAVYVPLQRRRTKGGACCCCCDLPCKPLSAGGHPVHPRASCGAACRTDECAAIECFRPRRLDQRRVGANGRPKRHQTHRERRTDFAYRPAESHVQSSKTQQTQRGSHGMRCLPSVLQPWQEPQQA